MNSLKEAIILAGGEGWRLKPATWVPKPLLQINKNTLIDIQGLGKQVVGPGSLHPNGKHYSVVNDSEISFISNDSLKILLADFITKEEDKLKR